MITYANMRYLTDVIDRRCTRSTGETGGQKALSTESLVKVSLKYT